MSNHTGSYMINDILKTLKKISVFEILGREKIAKLGFGYSGNIDPIRLQSRRSAARYWRENWDMLSLPKRSRRIS